MPTEFEDKNNGFLPINRLEMNRLGWTQPDFVYVSGDAYVDHPSFGPAIISRVLEDAGFTVAMLPQPDYRSADAFREFGKPRLGFLVSSGNIDSMVAHYTVSKKKRNFDYYSPGGKIGFRPDRAVIVYCNRIREAYGDIPILIGGLEASLRRFAHYDYWEDRVRRSILVDSRADILMYGMGEKIIVRVAELLNKGIPVKKIQDVRGTCYLTQPDMPIHFPVAATFDFNELKTDKRRYAEAFGVQYREQDAICGKAIVELYDGKKLVQNPPMPPLEQEELDHVYDLPYMRTYHPSYEKAGGIPGISEVRFSITHNRGCFGSCNFCALTFHQGRSVRSRSIASCVREAEKITKLDGFKGYIHDVGGPTANFRRPACDMQLTKGVCPNRKCLAPVPCRNLVVDHSEYIALLHAIEQVPKVKKVFIRSGIRFDYLIYDQDESFFRKLVRDHVSGQLKVAPEHCCDTVLHYMGKPEIGVYNRFVKRFFELTKECGKEQYLVPYLMSSHPGSRMEDAVHLAEYLKKGGYSPEQVQDFYPTPGTVSTCMYYTGIDPITMKNVYVTTDYTEKKLQRALLQWGRPENAALVREALRRCGREDLIGNGPEHLVRPERSTGSRQNGVPAKHRYAGSSDDARKKGRQNGGTSKMPLGQKTSKKNSPGHRSESRAGQKKNQKGKAQNRKNRKDGKRS